MIVYLYWVGAAFMVASTFIIDTTAGKCLAIAGLLILTIQTAKQGQYNLVALNLFSIVGYLWSILI